MNNYKPYGFGVKKNKHFGLWEIIIMLVLYGKILEYK